jgi:hypothetical protein
MFSPNVGGAIPGALHGAACCLQHNSHVTVTEIQFALVSWIYEYTFTYSVSHKMNSHKTRQFFSKLKFIKNNFPAQHNYAIQVQQCDIVSCDRHNTHSLLLRVLRFSWQCGWGLGSCGIWCHVAGYYSQCFQSKWCLQNIGNLLPSDVASYPRKMKLLACHCYWELHVLCVLVADWSLWILCCC